MRPGPIRAHLARTDRPAYPVSGCDTPCTRLSRYCGLQTAHIATDLYPACIIPGDAISPRSHGRNVEQKTWKLSRPARVQQNAR